jgi:hypothetical protein
MSLTADGRSGWVAAHLGDVMDVQRERGQLGVQSAAAISRIIQRAQEEAAERVWSLALSLSRSLPYVRLSPECPILAGRHIRACTRYAGADSPRRSGGGRGSTRQGHLARL